LGDPILRDGNIFLPKMESEQYLKPQEIIDRWPNLNYVQKQRILKDYAKTLDEMYHKHLYWKVYHLLDDDCGTDKYKSWCWEVKPEKNRTSVDKEILEALDKITLSLVKAVKENFKNKPY